MVATTRGMASLTTHPRLRRAALGLLRRLASRDITIQHHWTGDRLRVHAFRHRNYWFQGKRREALGMAQFARFLRPGDVVIEVGGHIGYLSLYFARLTAPGGRVTVFEPGPNNLPYLLRNTRPVPAITVIEAAISNATGRAQLYVEQLSGQNNSIVPSFSTFVENATPTGDEHPEAVDVPCYRLDDYLSRTGHPLPAFVKIDIEGAELSALQGMPTVLAQPEIALMIEVSEHPNEIFALLQASGFTFYSTSMRQITQPDGFRADVFCTKGPRWHSTALSC